MASPDKPQGCSKIALQFLILNMIGSSSGLPLPKISRELYLSKKWESY